MKVGHARDQKHTFKKREKKKRQRRAQTGNDSLMNVV